MRVSNANARAQALRDVLFAFVSSRALVWLAGTTTAVVFGLHVNGAPELDPGRLVTPFHSTIGNVLVAPAARFDSTWFLGIAKSGYTHTYQTVFFPLYPALIGVGGALVGNGWDIVFGILISCGCAIAALYLLHRLVALDFGAKVARNTVWIFAWLPITLFLSAVYSEALFLLLSVGSLYSARLGRWWLAGLLGVLAAATRNTGILLVIPLLLLYLYGPRGDRQPNPSTVRLKPRYRLRPDILWIVAVPIGLIAYLVYLKLALGHSLAPFVQQRHWHRNFIPLGGIALGIWGGLRVLIAALPGGASLVGRHVNDIAVVHRATELGFLPLGLWLLRESWRRLPAAYTVLAVISFCLAVSVPTPKDPLKSLPRFTLVLFPLWIALAIWATEHRRIRTVLIVCAPLIALWSFLFTSWTQAS